MVLCLVMVSGSFLMWFLFLLVQVVFDLLQSLPWYLSVVAGFGLCSVFASMDVLSALRLLYSVRGSLLLSWIFFVCATPSSVSGCLRVLLLWSVTRSDLRFPLVMELHVGTSPLCFSLLLCLLLRLCRQLFVGCSLVFILVSVSEVFLSSFVFLPGFVLLSLLVGVFHSIFSAFFFSFHHPGLFVAFPFPVLCHSSVFLRGVLCVFLP